MKLSFVIVQNELGNLEVYSRRDLNLVYRIMLICIVGICLTLAIWLISTDGVRNSLPDVFIPIISTIFPLYVLYYAGKRIEIIKVVNDNLLLEEINGSGNSVRSFNSLQIEKMVPTFDPRKDLPIGELNMTQWNMSKGRITIFLTNGTTVQCASLINYEDSLKLIKLIQDALTGVI